MEGWGTFLLAAGGITLGWLLNQFSAWWSLRGQRQRTYRRMLFFLLQMEWLFERLNVFEYMDHYFSRMTELGGPSNMPEEIEDMIKGSITAHLMAESMKRTSEDLAQLEAGYVDAVTQLSFISPFIAHQLEGRTSILARLEGAKEVAGSMVDPMGSFMSALFDQLGVAVDRRAQFVKEQAMLADPPVSQIRKALTDMQPELLEEDLEQMRSFMVAIAWRIGPVTWWKTKRGYRPHGALSQPEKEEFDEKLDMLLGRMPLVKNSVIA